MKRGIIADRDELRSLKNRLGAAPFDDIYDLLQKRCSLILESAPVTEAKWRMLWQQGKSDAALSAARTAQGRMLDLLVAHHIDPNTAFRDRAVEELKNLCSWQSWTDPGLHAGREEAPQADLCTAEASVAAVIALDWLWEDLETGDRESIIAACMDKGVRPYLAAVAEGAWWSACYHHWNAVINSGCALAALALSDEHDEAARAFEKGVGKLAPFFDALGSDGGWDEGVTWWAYAMRYLMLLACGQDRLTGDRKILHARGMDATGLFPVYFSPHGQWAGFGDMIHGALPSALYLLVRYFDRRELGWWLDKYSFQHDVGTSGWSMAGLAMLLRPKDLPAPKEDKPKLEPVKSFETIGWAAMADHWPRPSFYAAVKTGDLSAYRSHRDMNSVHLQVDGEMLLTGRYNQRSEKSSWAHNTITVGERDQEIIAQGRIVKTVSHKNYRWILCNADVACGEHVRFLRHVVMTLADGAADALVVVDELTNAAAEKIQLAWHTPGEVRTASAGPSKITGAKASLWFDVACSPQVEMDVETGRVSTFRLTAAAAREAMFVSAFCRKKPASRIKLDRKGGGLLVKAAGRTLQFKPSPEGMMLTSV